MKPEVACGGRKCVPLKILHGRQHVGEGEVRQRVIRGDLEGLGEDVGRVVGAVHAVQDVGQGQEPVVPVVTSTKLHGFLLLDCSFSFTRTLTKLSYFVCFWIPISREAITLYIPLTLELNGL